MKARADENSSDKRITKATALWVVVLWVKVAVLWVVVAALWVEVAILWVEAAAVWVEVAVLRVEVTEWVEVAALQRGDGGEKLGIKISVSASA